ncbi:MAG: malto-oligosyltrehalose trehalohydrolase, partial [Candidatus Eremiobacteraeota bacterium]|nr:malto-oligosyltrehalose trehalohydrolase [Candidatus Eremiobacteraeota bacterium]
MPFGAQLEDGGVRFRLYAPSASSVELLYDAGSGERSLALARTPQGFHEVTCAAARAGTRYAFRSGGLTFPDPASRFQPDGVHGRSVVVDPESFAWPDDGWRGLAWNRHVFYETHVGTFTPQGTYEAAQTKFDHLAALGITAIELMPLAEVPGARNWGYDGVLPFAPTRNYGTPDQLKAFVSAAHARGFAVFLDVVYNHFGPEGNYLHAYAPEFYTERHETPWGAAIDVEAVERDAVRAYFIENALYWLMEYRFDGLRLDAVHAIYDGAERHFLRELAATVNERVDRPVHLVLENEANEAPLLEAGFRAQWDDDAHHAAHVAITGQTDGYYSDYARDTIGLLGRTLTQGFAYQDDPSPFRGGEKRGSPSAHLPLGSFVTFLQNHDQVGNRPFGERIGALAPESALRAILAVLLLAPPPPMLFMGEEWNASSPFLFFCNFEPELAAKVTEGRRGEFAAFAEFADPQKRDRIPDPAAVATFERSVLRWDEIAEPPHRAWLDYYARLLAIRNAEIAPRTAHVCGPDASYETIGDRGLRARFRLDDGKTLALEANLGSEPLGVG